MTAHGVSTHGPAAADAPPPRKPRSPSSPWALTLVVFVAFVAAWEWAVGFFELPAILLPPPSRVVAALWADAASGLYLKHGLTTLEELAWGFSVGTVLGVVVAALLTHSRLLERVFYPYVIALQTFPKIGAGTFKALEVDGLATRGIAPPKSNWARPIDRPPFLAYPMISSNVFTFGGLKVNPDAQVLNSDGEVIRGLYAAGETMGYYRTYAGSTSVLRGLVFGRIAARHAAGLVRAQG